MSVIPYKPPARVRVKRVAKEVTRHFRSFSRATRLGPRFIIIGAQKAGTTSLYHYCLGLDGARRPLGQELDYFLSETLYGRGARWYGLNFPAQSKLPLSKRSARSGSSRSEFSFEATGEYLYGRDVPQRIFEFDPDIRLIAVLRDPWSRAVSQYRHNLKYGLESRTLDEALRFEMCSFQGAGMSSADGDRRFRSKGSRLDYLGRSNYGFHLKPWFEVFGPEAILLLSLEQLSACPTKELERLNEFLDLSRPPELSNLHLLNAAVRSQQLSLSNEVAEAASAKQSMERLELLSLVRKFNLRNDLTDGWSRGL